VQRSGRNIKARCKEHQRYIHLHQPEKSAVAEDSTGMGHCINFRGTSILDRTSGYVDHFIKEATEIHLAKSNFNRDTGFILSQACSSITNMLMNVKAGPSTAGTGVCPPTLLSHHQL
jgi:hypothetical protein